MDGEGRRGLGGSRMECGRLIEGSSRLSSRKLSVTVADDSCWIGFLFLNFHHDEEVSGWKVMGIG